jgi:hypothetical protein
MSKSKEGKSLYALRHLIVSAGFNYKEAKRNKNFEVISTSVELGFLTESDIKFMLDKDTSEIMAENRLIRRRHEYYGES